MESFFFFNLINKKFDLKFCPGEKRGRGGEKSEPQDFWLANWGVPAGTVVPVCTLRPG